MPEAFVPISVMQRRMAEAEAEGNLALAAEFNRKINARIAQAGGIISIQENNRRLEWNEWIKHARAEVTDGQTIYVCDVCNATAPSKCKCDWGKR